MRCISSARYVMKATILSKVVPNEQDTQDIIDDITFAYKGEWNEDGNNKTAGFEPVRKVNCLIVPFRNSTFRSSQNNTTMSNAIVNINEYLEMKVPYKTNITTNDRVTEIKDLNNNLLWVEEESNNEPTVFSVASVSPVFDALNRPQEKYIVLKRAQVQDG